MENTIENKAKFFALYWGQDIQYYSVESRASFKVSKNFEMGIKTYYLELKPLSSITDEDAKEIFVIYYGEYCEECDDMDDIRRYINEYICGESCDYPPQLLTLINTIDYIRSKGYALPWMGLSVETLIEYGWVKLKS